MLRVRENFEGAQRQVGMGGVRVEYELLISRSLSSCHCTFHRCSLHCVSALTATLHNNNKTMSRLLSHRDFTIPLPIHSTLSSGTATPINHSVHPNPAPTLTYTPNPTANNAYTPAESLEIVSRMGVKKAHTRLDKAFLSAISAGMILAFACATLVSTNTAPWYQENAPGLIRTLAALVFPYGLVIVQMTGSDLCTGSFMYTTVAALQRRIGVLRMLRHWGVTFVGNFVGSLFLCCVVVGCEYLFRGNLRM